MDFPSVFSPSSWLRFGRVWVTSSLGVAVLGLSSLPAWVSFAQDELPPSPAPAAVAPAEIPENRLPAPPAALPEHTVPGSPFGAANEFAAEDQPAFGNDSANLTGTAKLKRGTKRSTANLVSANDGNTSVMPLVSPTFAGGLPAIPTAQPAPFADPGVGGPAFPPPITAPTNPVPGGGYASLGPGPSPAQATYNSPPGGYQGLTTFDRAINGRPLIRVNTRQGSYYGYNTGFTSVGAMLPRVIDENVVGFLDGRGIITNQGLGGAVFGGGYRSYVEDLDRIFGWNVYYDFDGGHIKNYHQVGVGFESLGRYMDLTANGYVPVGKTQHLLDSHYSNTPVFVGNNIALQTLRTSETAFYGFDIETGGPAPILGRYGLSGYAGFYYFTAATAGHSNLPGVTARGQLQVNSDTIVGVAVSNDHVFGTNTQIQVTWTLPDGSSTNWFQPWRVRDRLIAPVRRNDRIVANTVVNTATELALNPNNLTPIIVDHIDPNATTNGDGKVLNPFSSLANFTSSANPGVADIIFVHPRIDGTDTNLNSGVTLLNGQRLLSSTTSHIFTAAQGTFNLPGLETTRGGVTLSAPVLSNTTGGDVVTLSAVQGPALSNGYEVSGFTINGSATGGGISGFGVAGVNINNNTIQNGTFGVQLLGVSGTGPTQEFAFYNNQLLNNTGNGLTATTTGLTDVYMTGNAAAGNGGDGFQLTASGGGTLRGVIDSNTTTTTGTTKGNTGNGLHLIANGGTLNFSNGNLVITDPAQVAFNSNGAPIPITRTIAYGITNNSNTTTTSVVNGQTTTATVENGLIRNGLAGLLVDSTNNSTVNLLVTNNYLGSPNFSQQNGFVVNSDSGVMNLTLGGSTSALGNLIAGNTANGVLLNIGGTTTGFIDARNNQILGVPSTSTVGVDAVTGTVVPDTVLFDGGQYLDFAVTNASTTNATITGLLFDASTAVSAAHPQGFTFHSGGGAGTGIEAFNVNTTTGVSPTTINGLAFNAANFPAGGPASINNTPTINAQFGATTLTKGLAFKFGSDTDGPTGDEEANNVSDLAGTKVTVTYSDGHTTTGTFQVDPANANQLILNESLQVGSLAANNGFHLVTSGTASLNSVNFSNNTVTGNGGHGIFIEAGGPSPAVGQGSNVTVGNIANNTVTGNGSVNSGDGLRFVRSDGATGNWTVTKNTFTGNSGNGANIQVAGYNVATPDLTINSIGNAYDSNSANGLLLTTNGTGANVVFSSVDDTFRNNTLNGSSVSAGGADVLTATFSQTTPNAASFSGNKVSGFVGGASGTANYQLTLSNRTISNNGGPNFAFTRTGSSTSNLTLNNDVFSNSTGGSGALFTYSGDNNVNNVVNLTNSTISGNAANGLSLVANGNSNATVNWLANSITGNGTTGNGNGGAVATFQGSTTTTLNLADSTLALGGISNNKGDGVQVSAADSSKGVVNLDNTYINGNTGDGVHLIANASLTTSFVNPDGSFTFIDTNGNQVTTGPNVHGTASAGGALTFNGGLIAGNTIVSNSGNGFNVDAAGGFNNNITLANTKLQSNSQDAIRINSNNSAANAQSGGLTNLTFTNNTLPSFSGLGFDIIAKAGTANITATNNVLGTAGVTTGTGGIKIDQTGGMSTGLNAALGVPEFWGGNLTANFTGNTVQNVGGNGVDITIGDTNSFDQFSKLTFVNNNISHASGIGISYISRGIDARASTTHFAGPISGTGPWVGANAVVTSNYTLTNGTSFRALTLTGNTIDSSVKQGILIDARSNTNSGGIRVVDTLASRFPVGENAVGLTQRTMFDNTNAANPANTAATFRDWANLANPNVAGEFNFTGNTITNNGNNNNSTTGGFAGVDVTVGTGAFLKMTVTGNTFAGNRGTDFITQSVLSNTTAQPTGSLISTATFAAPNRAANTTDRIVLDNQAQLQLKFDNNTGDSIASMNARGAYYTTSDNNLLVASDPGYAFYKQQDTVLQTGQLGRSAFLFQVDLGTNNNVFTKDVNNGLSVTNAFVNGLWVDQTPGLLFP